MAWLPKPPAAHNGSGVLRVQTHPHSLLIYHGQGEEPKHIHADQARRWQAEHRRKLARTNGGAIHQDRSSGNGKRHARELRQVWVAKYRQRMDSLTHEVSAQIAEYASRHAFSAVMIELEDRGYIESFPWHELRRKLAAKLDAAGIELSNGRVRGG